MKYNQVEYWAHMLDEAMNDKTMLTEGDHWPEDYYQKLIKKIKASQIASYYSSNQEIETDAQNIIKDFDNRAFDGDSTHRFSNTMISYFNKVVEWFIAEASTSVDSYKQFLEMKLPNIVQFLKNLESNKDNEKLLRPKIKAMNFQDFENFVKSFREQNAKDEADKLKNQSFDAVERCDVIRIDSYEQMHALFGGKWTGINGRGNWCHTNGNSTYNSWVKRGKFFVIAAKNWKDIPCPENPKNALDEYGSSLCAILVSPSNGNLLKSTLRYNHECEVNGRTADSAFQDWADLNEFYQQDIRTEVLTSLKKEIEEYKDLGKNADLIVNELLKSVKTIENSTIPQKLRQYITKIVIPSNVTSTGNEVFFSCSGLTSVTIPDSVTSIGDSAFFGCSRLTSVTIPSSVTSIWPNAFDHCQSLKTIFTDNPAEFSKKFPELASEYQVVQKDLAESKKIKYSRKQILEAIAHWERVLEETY